MTISSVSPTWRGSAHCASGMLGGTDFQAPTHAGVPTLIELERLQQITERILRDEETDEDLQMIFAPGIIVGRRPSQSVAHRSGRSAVDRQISQGHR